MAKPIKDFDANVIAAFNKINRETTKVENLIEELKVEFVLDPNAPTNSRSPAFWLGESLNSLTEVKASLVKALVLQ